MKKNLTFCLIPEFLCKYKIMRKSEKEWKICVFCKYKKACAAGAGRILDLPPNSPIINEIGCFEYETYKKQKVVQIRLFD